jgi:hypothetical protein
MMTKEYLMPAKLTVHKNDLVAIVNGLVYPVKTGSASRISPEVFFDNCLFTERPIDVNVIIEDGKAVIDDEKLLREKSHFYSKDFHAVKMPSKFDDEAAYNAVRNGRSASIDERRHLVDYLQIIDPLMGVPYVGITDNSIRFVEVRTPKNTWMDDADYEFGVIRLQDGYVPRDIANTIANLSAYFLGRHSHAGKLILDASTNGLGKLVLKELEKGRTLIQQGAKATIYKHMYA